MTDPISPDPITPDPVSPDPFATDPRATDATSVSDAPPATAADHPAAAADKDRALTPLYAAAGLVEVVATQLRGRLGRTQAQAGTLPTATKSRVAELQQQLKTYSDKVASGYNSLATRGKPTVDSTLVTVRHLSGRAERKVEDLKPDPAPPTLDTPPVAEQVQPVIVEPVVDVHPDDTGWTTPRDGI